MENDFRSGFSGGEVKGALFYVIVTMLLASLVIIAILAGDIGPIFTYVGAIACNSIAYILPYMFFLRLYKKRNFIYYFTFFLLIFQSFLALTCIICEGF